MSLHCQECGTKNAAAVKHLHMPGKENEWITLMEWEALCGSCAIAKAENYCILIAAARQKYLGEGTA